MNTENRDQKEAHAEPNSAERTLRRGLGWVRRLVMPFLLRREIGAAEYEYLHARNAYDESEDEQDRHHYHNLCSYWKGRKDALKSLCK